MTDHVPSWLLEATRRHPGRIARPGPGAIAPGDLCLIEDAGEARIVLVIALDDRVDIASVVLAHNEHELRTDQDILIDAVEADLPYALAIETDVIAPVPRSSLDGTRIGALRVDVAPYREAAQTGVLPEELRGREGMALRGPSDARWSWKAAEGAWIVKAAEAMEERSRMMMVDDLTRLIADLRSVVGSGSTFGGGRSEGELGRELASLLMQAGRTGTPLQRPALRLLARPRVAALMGRDTWRAIEPMLLVA